MAEFSSCMKCNFETAEPSAHCPQCGRRLVSSRKVRMLGWLLVGLGGFLVVMMPAITVLVATNFSHFTGTSKKAMFMFVLLVIIFDLALFVLSAVALQIY